MKNNFKIAYRFIKSNKAQTILISLGIAIGVTVQLFLGLLINNLNDNLLNKTIGNASQITIESLNNDKYIGDYNKIISDIKANEEGIITKIMGVLDSPVITRKDDTNKSLLVRGIEYSNDNDIYGIKENIVDGDFPSEKNQVLIGKGISENLGLKVNDNLVFEAPGIGEKTVVISGIIDLKVKNLNDMWVLTSLENGQELFDKQNEVTSIEMQINNDNVFDVDLIADNIASYIPSDLELTNWKVENESILDALSGQKTSSITIQVFIIISVTMSIAGVLAISVMQKSKQIGILKAMGITDKSAASIFIMQGLIFGVIGSGIGTILGVGFFKIFTAMVKTSDGSPLVPGNMYYGFIILSMIISILASVIASILAAKKSLKLDPIDIIKNN